MSVGIIAGNVRSLSVVPFTFDPTSIGTYTVSELTVTCMGAKTTDMVFVNKPTTDAGLGVVNARVSAADTLAIALVNPTAAAIDAGSETWNALVVRPESGTLSKVTD